MGGCLHNSAYFSSDLTYAAVDCQGPEVPKVLLFEGAEMTGSKVKV